VLKHNEWHDFINSCAVKDQNSEASDPATSLRRLSSGAEDGQKQAQVVAARSAFERKRRVFWDEVIPMLRTFRPTFNGDLGEIVAAYAFHPTFDAHGTWRVRCTLTSGTRVLLTLVCTLHVCVSGSVARAAGNWHFLDDCPKRLSFSFADSVLRSSTFTTEYQRFFFLNVKCPELDEFRARLGIAPKPAKCGVFGYRITLAVQPKDKTDEVKPAKPVMINDFFTTAPAPHAKAGLLIPGWSTGQGIVSGVRSDARSRLCHACAMCRMLNAGFVCVQY
jgi:hypothetical protein